MDLKNIRVYNGSQNAAFEEFVCQLARNEKYSIDDEFVRNGTPDGGAECFWTLKNGEEHVWQAKYVFEIKNVLTQAQRSFYDALNNYPKMSRFVLAIPYDLPNPNYQKKGKNVKGARQKWDDKAKAWEKEAEAIGRNVKVELWTKSDLLNKIRKEENKGLRERWFGEKELTIEWFREKFKIAVTDLGKKDCLDENSDIREFRNILDKLELLQKKSENPLSNKPLLLDMDASIGEYSLLADFCRRMLEREIPALLFPGTYFTNPLDPKLQIAQLLDQELTFEYICKELNIIGQEKGERTLIAIDDLGAMEGSKIWPSFMNGMLTELEKYPWIAFAASVQSKDADRVLPDRCEEKMVKVSYTNSVGMANGYKDNKPVISSVEKEPVRGLFLINSATVASYKIDRNNQIIKTFLRISTNLKYILYAACSNAVIECTQENSETTLSDCLQAEINKGRQAVFLIGNGGIGKTTALVKAAIGLCDSKKEIYLFQLGKNNDSEVIDEVVRRIVQEREASKKKNYVLFIDNPYDNSDGLKNLLNEIEFDTNVQVVIAERLNRFELIAEDVLPDLYFNVAKIIVPVFKRKKIHITQFDAKQIAEFKISANWKFEVVLHMFRSIEGVDMSEIESIAREQNKLSIIEWYLRVCIAYNKRVDEDSTVEPRCKVNLDWDEWKQMFCASRLEISENESRELQGLFQVIAAFDIFKIKSSIRFLSIKSKIEELRLNDILQSTLKTAGSEPAIYEDDGENRYIALKHDMISTLYFEVTKLKPQYILEQLVDMLGADKRTVISFEKQVFKRKYIQSEYRVPFDIDIRKLYTMFNKETYYEILAEADRTYSFDVAKVWMQDADHDKSAVSDMWGQVLQNYASAKPQIKRKVYGCCMDDCNRRSISKPLMLLFEYGDIVALNDAKVNNDPVKIADVWKKTLTDMYKEKMEEELYFSYWNKVIFDYFRYEFEMPEEFFWILDYVEYQIVDALYTNIEIYVKLNGLNRFRYYELGKELYKRIAEKQPADIPSRMNLANCYIQFKEFEAAEKTYKEILRKNPNHAKTLSALGSLYAKWLQDRWRELVNNQVEAERLEKGCEMCLERAIELADIPEDKSACYGALGWFLFRTKNKFQESYKAFQMALKCYEQSSTHSQLAMLCSFLNKNNDCFSIDEAEEHFKRAISLLRKNNFHQVSNYMPYANMLYYIGEYDRAVDMYKKASRLGEKKADKMIDKIRQEREELKHLKERPTETIATLQEAHDLICENEGICLDEQIRDEILSILLKFQPEEESARYEIRQTIKIMLALRKVQSKIGYNIIIYRVTQRIERFAMQYDVNSDLAEKNFRSQCFYIQKYFS